MKAGDIIEKYEVPREFHEAMFEAYAEGAKRGFIDGSISVYNHTERIDLLVNRPALDTLRPSDAPKSAPKPHHHKEG